MTVESTTTIDGLNSSLPAAGDLLIEGDNHLRLLKIVTKNIFRGVGNDGFITPITATEAQLNHLQGLTEGIETQLIDLRKGAVPVGGIQHYIGSFAFIPDRFFLCDGNNGTPNLSNVFVFGASSEGSLGATGGDSDDVIISHTHNADHDHTGNTNTTGDHNHNFDVRGSNTVSNTLNVVSPNRVSLYNISTELDGDHVHAVTMTTETINTAQTGVSPTNTNLPKYYKSAYIMRVS